MANLADGGTYPAVRPKVISARKIALAPDDLLLPFSLEVFPQIALKFAHNLTNDSSTTDVMT